MGKRRPLSEAEQAIYQWQMWVPDFGAAGQERLKGASVLVSRVGGVGGSAAYQLAAAGVGRIVLAHAGDIRPSDLNRQLLMTDAAVGTPRMDVAPERLRQLNPLVEIEAFAENVGEANVDPLAGRMLLGDLREGTFRTMRVRRRPGCAVCGLVGQAFQPDA